MARAMTRAATFGQVTDHSRCARLVALVSPNSRASSPASSDSKASGGRGASGGRWGTRSASMAGHLGAQLLGDGGGQPGDLRRLDPAGAGEPDGELGGD